MRLRIGARPARAAALCAIAARVFMGLTVDMPTTRNGAWLSALFGALLAGPWLAFLRYARARGMLLRSALLAVTVIDAAAVLAALARSAGYLALDRTSPALLAIPAGIALLWGVWRNGDAVGYAAMIWARIALALLLIVGFLQARSFKPAWLTPVLGSGWPDVLDGGVHAAGWIVSASGILFVVEEDGGAGPALGALAGGVGVAALLIVLAGMLTPTRALSGWIIRLDDLLCNGRAPLYLQLPLIALWFAALLHLLACQCFAAAALVQRLTGAGGRLCGTLIVLAALLLSRVGVLEMASAMLARYGFAATAALTALSARRKGGLSA